MDIGREHNRVVSVFITFMPYQSEPVDILKALAPSVLLSYQNDFLELRLFLIDHSLFFSIFGLVFCAVLLTLQLKNKSSYLDKVLLNMNLWQFAKHEEYSEFVTF